MKNDFDSLDELLTDLNENIISISYGAIRDEIIDNMYDRIMYMYTLYDNSKLNRYEQGEEGSFGDINMIEVNVDITNQGIKLTGLNQAKGSEGAEDEYLDKYIEEGIYDYSRAYVPERPVSEWVIEQLEERGVIEKLLERELKKRGYDIN